jgi:hypothetical protein
MSKIKKSQLYVYKTYMNRTKQEDAKKAHQYKEEFKSGRGGGKGGTGLIASGAALGVATNSGAGSGGGSFTTVACLKDSSSFYCKLTLFLGSLKMIIMIVLILCLVVALFYYGYKYFGGSSKSSKSKK